LKAIWQFESNASFGSGNTSFGGRNSYLGLQGDWGTLLGGKHDTPFKTTGRKFDLFGDQVGDSRNLIQLSYAGDNWDLRPNNVVAYKSPKMGGGFDIVAAYVLDDATDNSNALSASLNWKTGDFFTSLAYESHDEGLNTGPDSSSGIRLGLQWSPGAWKLNAFYQTISDIDGFSGDDADAYGVGAGYKMGKSVLKAQYYAISPDVPGVNDIDSTTVAVGWDYNMSKRTTAYIAYAMTSNDTNTYACADAGGHGAEICGQAGTTAVAGDDPSVVSFGMVHKF
jgi:predicted porin